MKISAFYVGSSLLSPLKQSEQSIVADYGIKVLIKTYNLGAALNEAEWAEAESDLMESSIVFVFHVVDGENSSRLLNLLAPVEGIDRTVIVVNCMPDLMRCTQMGRLQFSKLFGRSNNKRSETAHDFEPQGRARRLFSLVPHSEATHRSCSMRWSAGYSEPSSTLRTSLEMRWMCSVMPQPCIGPCSRVFRTSNARVPWRLSFFVFAMTAIPLDIYRRMPLFIARVKLLCKLARVLAS